ncbi:MAG TPA: PKD domain-containing protein [Flavisolibacter sp.]|nr:PKD domain-containing protein [Flavisolibacter sp.]
MRKQFFFLPLLLIGIAATSQGLQASFHNFSGCAGRTYYYNDLSTTSAGNIVFWLWNFGDGNTSNQQNPVHVYSSPGSYNVSLQVKNDLGASSTITKTVIISPALLADFSIIEGDSCSIRQRSFSFRNTSQNSGSQVFWSFGDGGYSYSMYPSHTYAANGSYNVMFYINGLPGCIDDTIVKTIQVPAAKKIIPAAGLQSLTANIECEDPNDYGWTNYYYNNNTVHGHDDILLLSLKKNGNDIGNLWNGLTVKVSATQGAGSNTGVLLTNPLITNPSGFWVMNRFWEVTPATQPTTPVGVRFYYNTQDLADVNGSHPSHSLTHTNLLFYKSVGGNPDPTTNLAGATSVISITNGNTPDLNKWVYTDMLYGRHMAEFKVAGFSGGGGGATGNLAVLPVKLLSFETQLQQNRVQLKWSVANPEDVDRFVIERSFDGVNFNQAKTVRSNGKQSFSETDQDFRERSYKIHYRLKMVERNGAVSYSKIISVALKPGAYTFTISPNPARDYLVVDGSLPSNQPLQLKLIDVLGRNVFTKKLASGLNEKVLLPSSLQNGIYHVIVSAKEQSLFSTSIQLVK